MRKTYVVTGATSGIGQAIANSLAQRRHRVIGVGRNGEALASLSAAFPEALVGCRLDLTKDEEIERFSADLQRDSERIDGLILCAGVLHTGSLLAQTVADLDEMYRSNLRAPAVLIKQLFPLIKAARGYVIFVNSSAGLTTRAGVGAHSAIQHALRVFADALRLEVNEDGVRVLSIYPGRTATPRMAGVFAREGRDYSPELLLQSEDVAKVVIQALELPSGAELTDVSIRSAVKSY